MWMVNKIFHAMYDIKEIGLYWGIHVSTETHGRVLIFVPSLNSDVNEANNPVIKGYSMQVINIFWLHKGSTPSARQDYSGRRTRINF